MSKFRNIKTGSNQLRWVILLLGIAVILPTVCLLWFMTQAVKNERLAVRQKLIDAYKLDLEQIATQCDQQYNSLWKRFIRDIKQSQAETGKSPIRLITNLVAFNSAGPSLIVYGPSGHVEFPKLENDIEPNVDNDQLGNVWNIEFVDKDYDLAIKKYAKIIEDTNDKIVKSQALVAKARCLTKKEQYLTAIEVCNDLFSIDVQPDISINNYIMLIELYIKTEQNYDDLANGLLTTISNSDRPLSIREFGLEKLQAFTENGNSLTRLSKYHQVYGDIKAERQSLTVARKYQNISLFGKWHANTIQKIETAPPTYILFFENDTDKYIIVNPPLIFSPYTKQFKEDSFICKFKDNTEHYVECFNNQLPATKPILSAPMGDTFPGWSVELYMKDASIFDNAASKQAAIYTWTGILVVALILGSGVMAGQVINRQMKLNRLKNDFIATVTHELKTPLSSMRVLVDTLLEGNYSDQQQASEYLQLIAKENVRLSRLIDNFLTFSRMERNKQAFEIVKTDPAEIAQAAADAVQTKFNDEKCKFTVRIEPDLASIMADKDAMVTVLVNLLDNAYKYSYDDKQIELRVFSEEANICFSVKDNGIGMTRRQIKRVFDRFYQADSSLSRRAEGTGLGLAIVKFILDAHKAKIEVESKPGKGSEFVVKFTCLKSHRLTIYGNSFNNRR